MKKLILMMVAVLFAASTFAQTKIEMKPADLFKPAAEYIAKNFTGYNIDKVFKCNNKATVTYEVMITKGKEKQALAFDKDGRFLKKKTVKAEAKPTVAITPVPSETPVKEEKKKEEPKKK